MRARLVERSCVPTKLPPAFHSKPRARPAAVTSRAEQDDLHAIRFTYATVTIRAESARFALRKPVAPGDHSPSVTAAVPA